MEDKILNIFTNVNKWLEYAERKNVILLSLISVELTLSKYFIPESGPNAIQTISIVFLGICVVITLFSFFPKTVIPWWFTFWADSKDSPKDNDNLLFYGHIVKYSSKDYIKKIEETYGLKIASDNYLKDLCSQIVINSQITNNKYNMFKVSFWFMLIGQILFIISLGL